MNKTILYIAERDVKFISNNFVFLIVQYISFSVQIFVYSMVLNALIPFMNYVSYYATGMTVLSLWSISMYTVYFVYGEKIHGILQYIMTLPISRREYVIGRVVGSSIRTLIYVIPLIFITLIVTGINNVVNLALILCLLGIFICGVNGVGVVLGSLIKGERVLDITIGVIDAFIVRISTIYYPQSAMDLWMQLGSQINPLSHIATILRWALGIQNFYSIGIPIELVIPIVFIIAFSTFLFFISLKIYESSLIQGGEHG